MIITLYHLVVDTEVVYVGLTRNVSVRRAEHRRKFPPHEFITVRKFSMNDLDEACSAEIDHIKQFETFVSFTKWNRSRGGDFLAGSSDRRGIGGNKKGSIPWNKGLKGEIDSRVRENATKAAITRRKNGVYDHCGDRLKPKYGDETPRRNPHLLECYKQKITGRKREYREDGTWFWQYPLGDIRRKI